MVTTALVTVLITAAASFIRKILFAVGTGLCRAVGILTGLFELLAGQRSTGGTGETGLIRVLFGNTNIAAVCWVMALIGVLLCVGFAVSAIIKKNGSTGDGMKPTTDDILGNMFRGVTLILLMNLILSSALNISSALLDRINYRIVNSREYGKSYELSFDSEDYAAMARSLDTIGNYSLNASYNSKYNLNSCYNDVREDLKQLADKGIFDVTYDTTTYDKNGNIVTVNTWQSVLQSVYRSVGDINREQPLDEYNAKLSKALLEAMKIIKNDASLEALEKYRVNQSVQQVGETVQLDRMIMLLGSMYGTQDNAETGGGMTDYIRGPYYCGQKDVFSYSQVSRDFDMSVGTWMYLTVIIAAFLFMKEMLALISDAAARIFNMLLLCISAPSVIAAAQTDNREKLGRWAAAFIIRSAGLFGTVLCLRLVMLLIPVLFSGETELFRSVRADTFAKMIIMYGAIFTARKASGMIVGILADNAAAQEFSAVGVLDAVMLSGRDTGALAPVRKVLAAIPSAAGKSRQGDAERKKSRIKSLAELRSSMTDNTENHETNPKTDN